MELFSSLIIFALTLVTISFLGLVAGFSPTLYIAQVSTSSKSKKDTLATGAIMAGVLLAIIVLASLFQTVQLDALLHFIDSTVKALIISIVLNIFVGIGLVVGGIWYIRAHSQPALDLPSNKKKRSIPALLGLGFIRTFTSISGVTATYVAASTISGASTSFFQQLIYTLIFVAAAIVPFVGIVILVNKHPARLTQLVSKLQVLVGRFDYHWIIGFIGVVFGVCIIALQLFIGLVF